MVSHRPARRGRHSRSSRRERRHARNQLKRLHQNPYSRENAQRDQHMRDHFNMIQSQTPEGRAAEPQNPLPMPSTSSALVLDPRQGFRAEIHRQFPCIPELDANLMTAWAFDNQRPGKRLPIAHAAGLPLERRVQMAAHSYTRHHRTDYDLNYRRDPRLPRADNLMMVQPAVELIHMQWGGFKLALQGAGGATRHGRFPGFTDFAAGQDGGLTALNAANMAQWLHQNNFLWPASNEVVNGLTQQMAPGLMSWLHSQADIGNKSPSQAASEMANMVPGLIDWLVSQNILSRREVQGRISEVKSEDGDDEGDATQQQAMTVHQPATWIQLPPEVEFQRLMATLARHLCSASQPQLIGSCMSLLGSVIYAARDGRL